MPNIYIYSLKNFAPMNINDLIAINYQEGNLEDEDLVQIIALCSCYLNLKTITNYAKSNKITYNGALKRKLRKIEIDKITFIIDNE